MHQQMHSLVVLTQEAEAAAEAAVLAAVAAAAAACAVALAPELRAELRAAATAASRARSAAEAAAVHSPAWFIQMDHKDTQSPNQMDCDDACQKNAPAEAHWKGGAAINSHCLGSHLINEC